LLACGEGEKVMRAVVRKKFMAQIFAAQIVDIEYVPLVSVGFAGVGQLRFCGYFDKKSSGLIKRFWLWQLFVGSEFWHSPNFVLPGGQDAISAVLP